MSTDHPCIFGKVSVHYIVHFKVVFHIIESGEYFIFLDTSPLSDIWLFSIFSQFVAYLFILLTFFQSKEFLNIGEVQLIGSSLSSFI